MGDVVHLFLLKYLLLRVICYYISYNFEHIESDGKTEICYSYIGRFFEDKRKYTARVL